MEKRLTKNNEEISLLGFGCMRFPKISPDKEDIDEEKACAMIDCAIENGINYFDTAYIYHAGMSEGFIGRALSKYPRESYNIADKMPPWELKTKDDIERIWQEQLSRCGVDYFDFYLMHGLGKDSFEKCKEFGLYDFMKQKKAEGKIRYIGFSFHDKPEVLQEIVDTYEWDFAQIQLNYLDWEQQQAKEQYEILTKKNIPVVVMEPVRGGALATLCDDAADILKSYNNSRSVASWAIRYVASLPGVMTILSGMSNDEQVKDNIETTSHFSPLSAKEREVLSNALAIYKSSGAITCTGCRYCMDCPMGINIPESFSVYNRYCITKNIEALKKHFNSLDDSAQPTNCVSCGVCMDHCPQHIKIPDIMKKINELL